MNGGGVSSESVNWGCSSAATRGKSVKGRQLERGCHSSACRHPPHTFALANVKYGLSILSSSSYFATLSYAIFFLPSLTQLRRHLHRQTTLAAAKRQHTKTGLPALVGYWAMSAKMPLVETAVKWHKKCQKCCCCTIHFSTLFFWFDKLAMMKRNGGTCSKVFFWIKRKSSHTVK